MGGERQRQTSTALPGLTLAGTTSSARLALLSLILPDSPGSNTFTYRPLEQLLISRRLSYSHGRAPLAGCFLLSGVTVEDYSPRSLHALPCLQLFNDPSNWQFDTSLRSRTTSCLKIHFPHFRGSPPLPLSKCNSFARRFSHHCCTTDTRKQSFPRPRTAPAVYPQVSTLASSS